MSPQQRCSGSPAGSSVSPPTLPAWITPIVVGAIIGATGSFFYALAYVGAAALLGALSYVFLLGDVERIMLD